MANKYDAHITASLIIFGIISGGLTSATISGAKKATYSQIIKSIVKKTIQKNSISKLNSGFLENPSTFQSISKSINITGVWNGFIAPIVFTPIQYNIGYKSLNAGLISTHSLFMYSKTNDTAYLEKFREGLFEMTVGAMWGPKYINYLLAFPSFGFSAFSLFKREEKDPIEAFGADFIFMALSLSPYVKPALGLLSIKKTKAIIPSIKKSFAIEFSKAFPLFFSYNIQTNLIIQDYRNPLIQIQKSSNYSLFLNIFSNYSKMPLSDKVRFEILFEKYFSFNISVFLEDNSLILKLDPDDFNSRIDKMKKEMKDGGLGVYLKEYIDTSFNKAVPKKK